ncbi:hypothetical protein [Streptomyces lateritius]|uniref:hypothetical protein n=1 Tax=Streptomyces lateritius TaxID=67313 RepID=UPI00167B4383|nr:hypothetical protein [Streptomyces lateritius]GGU11491.1 hypothetical protein GCM10010272_65930 [Streptomyces lateritius]
MLLYVGTVVCLIALYAGVSGAVALRSGWLIPWQRRHILRPRLYGWANLTFAAGLVVYWLGGVLPWNTTVRDGAIIVAGLVYLGAMWVQDAPRNREKLAGDDTIG